MSNPNVCSGDRQLSAYRAPENVSATRIAVGQTVQRDRYRQYRTDNSRNRWCHCPTHRNFAGEEFRDWPHERNTHTFGGGYYICSSPNASLCNIGNDSQGQDPRIDAFFRGTDSGNTAISSTRPIFCAYDVDKIDRPEQLQALQRQGVVFPGQDQDELMRHFCKQVSGDNCALKAGPTGEPMTQCTRYFQRNLAGDECLRWFNDLRERRPNYANALITNICQASPNLDECVCLRRSEDPLYNLFAPQLPANPGCWYWPCRNDTHAWLPSDIDNRQCPDICEAAINITANAENINLENVRQRVNCNFEGSGDPPTYSCLGGECQATRCIPGRDANCFRDPSCGKLCAAAQGSYQCLEGQCIQRRCTLGDPNCYAFAGCKGACSTNYTCREGVCEPSPAGEFINEAVCKQKCAQPKPAEIPWAKYISFVLWAVLIFCAVYFPLRLG